MGTCWGDISEGVRVEVINSDTALSTKVYWIAGIVKIAGEVHSGIGATVWFGDIAESFNWGLLHLCVYLSAC